MARPALPQSLHKQRRELTKLWLNHRRSAIALALLLAVLTGGWLGWGMLQGNMAQSEQRETDMVAAELVKKIKATLDRQVASVDEQLDLALLAQLLLESDQEFRRAREAELTAAIDGALGVRILEWRDDRGPDYQAMPPITYASLELMRARVQDGEQQRPEVLLFGEAEQHILVLRALKKATDETVIGFVLVALDVKPLVDAVAASQASSAFVELSQGIGKNAKVIGGNGVASLRQGAPTQTLPVKGTGLRVSLWSGKVSVAAEVDSTELPIELIGGLVVLVLGALAALVFVRKRKVKGARRGGVGASLAEVTSGLTDKLAALNSDSSEQDASATADGDAAAPGAEDSSEAVLSDEIFRAYDVRGVVGKTLTVEVVKLLGLAIGSEAYDRGQQTLCVARDGRISSPEMATALIEGLRESGRDVIDVGEVPTPVLYFATYYLETGSGVMVTGSHNPPDYNGLKIMLGGDTLFDEDIQALKQRILAGEFATGAGNVQTMDISADYIRRVSEDIPVALGNAFKVVVDCGNGVAGHFAPKLIRALGHDVVELYCEVDGKFPNHHPDPGQPENLQDLIAAVRENDADLGFAFDGDGDRLGVVDSNGQIVWPDAQMMLFARDVLSRNAGAEIVFDVKCTSRLGKVIARLGGKPVMYKTGHSYMKNKLKETGAPLAGEMSGHIFFKDRWYGFDDALYASARMLEILMEFKQRPAEVFAKLPAGVSTPELNVAMNEGENVLFMQSLGDTEQFADAKVSTIDGIRVDWPNRWGLVRASNTTPSLVLRFEGDDEQALEQVKDTFRQLLLEKKPNLSLPF